MKLKKHIFLIALLAVYALAVGVYEATRRSVPWSSVLITWGIFAVILVCLWFVMGKIEELRSRREMEDEMRQMEKMNPDLDDVIDKGVEDAESAGGDDDDDDAPVRPLNQ